MCRYYFQSAAHIFAAMTILSLPGCEFSPADQLKPIPPSAPMEGQIVVDPSNPAWLVYHGGGPHFLCGPGDPEDFLYRGIRQRDGTRVGDQEVLIEKLRDSGANAIYVQAVRSHGGDGESDHNPFVESDPERGLDETIVDQWNIWFTTLNELGVTIYFFIYDDSSRIWNTRSSVSEDEAKFVSGLVNRLKHHKRLVWVVAEE